MKLFTIMLRREDGSSVASRRPESEYFRSELRREKFISKTIVRKEKVTGTGWSLAGRTEWRQGHEGVQWPETSRRRHENRRRAGLFAWLGPRFFLFVRRLNEVINALFLPSRFAYLVDGGSWLLRSFVVGPQEDWSEFRIAEQFLEVSSEGDVGGGVVLLEIPPH